MSYQVFNSTLPIVKTEIDLFLKNYSIDHPYKKALSLPYFRQKFIAKILNNIPNNHILIDECYSFADNVNFYMDLLHEKLLINKQIINNISSIMKEYHQFINTNKKPNIHNKKDVLMMSSEVNWWLRIDTIKPCITYYFGPFNNLSEAKENYHGYVEDLIEEKAEGITFDFQFINPPLLTIEHDIDDLRWENQQLLKYIFNLEQKKKYFENLFLDSPNSYLIMNKNAIITFANNQAEKLLQTSKNNLINQCFSKFLSSDSVSSFFDMMKVLNQKEFNDDINNYFSFLKLILPDDSCIIIGAKGKMIKNIDNEIIYWYLSLYHVSYD